MPNFDGEWEIRWFYTTQPPGQLVLEHTHTYDVNGQGIPIAGLSFNDYQVNTKGGGTIDLDQHIVNDYLPLIQPLFSTTTSFIRAELWYAQEASTNFSYISSMAIGVNGTSGNDAVPAQQSTLTFRSIGGGIARLQYMESVIDSNAQTSAPFTNTVTLAIANYAVGASSPIIARDNTYLNAPNKDNEGQSEVLWRKRYRA